jgi:hypothetical protein
MALMYAMIINPERIAWIFLLDEPRRESRSGTLGEPNLAPRLLPA